MCQTIKLSRAGLTAFAVLAGLAAAARGGAITLNDVNANRVEDLTAGGDGTGDRAQADVLDIGAYGNSERTFPVFAFQMNSGLTLTAGQSVGVGAANFSVTQVAAGGGGTPPTGDAYALRTSSSPVILASDYQNFAQLLMPSFSDASTGPKQLNPSGQSALASYLQSNWSEGGYVFIGLKTNPINAPVSGTNVGRFGNAGGGWSASSTDAQLTATVSAVPEPGGLAALALGGLGLLARRRTV